MKTPQCLALFVALALATAGLAAGLLATQFAQASSGLTGVTTGAEYFSCALTNAGGARCWGNNSYGQLGDGTMAQRNTMVDVSGLTSGVAMLDAGDQHACAVTTSGGAKCWGRNNQGQLGNGSLVDSTTPVDVSGLTSGVSAVSAGFGYACALTTGGGVMCWGSNSLGHLGDGTVVDSSVPVQVVGLTSGVAAVSAGYNRTCALTVAGGVKCWGTASMTPVDVTGLTSGLAAVTAGFSHACARTGGGGVKCWGSNADGQLGNGTTIGSTTPVDVVGLTSGVVDISAGLDYTCAVTSAGAAKCWGANTFGELGNGATVSSNTPVNVAGMTSGALQIAASRHHTCALMTGGGAKCWGDNSSGELGDGTTTDSHTPISVAKPTPPPTATPTSTPLPPKDPDADTDGDTIANSVDADDDGDGCPDVNEVQLAAGSELSGGRRNPHDPNDYFNPSHDGQNRVDDVLAVVNAYFVDDTDGNPGLAPYTAGYNPDTDRILVGPLSWNLGPPNGQQRVDDVVNIVKQYFHDCS